MSLFSKLSKNNDKALYPWSQKKLGGTSNGLPRVRHASTAISSDAILVYGGVHRGTPKKDILLIDTNTMSAMSVMTIGDIPNTRISPTILHINGHILLYGGKSISSEEQYDPSVYLLNLRKYKCKKSKKERIDSFIENKQWTRLSTDGKLTPAERTGHSCSTHEGAVYIWGGQKEGRYFNDLFLFNINPTPKWDSLNCDYCPEPRAGHISAIYENKMYIFGGTDGRQHFNDLWSFDIKKHIWTKIEAGGVVPSPREGCSSTVVDDVIYVFGGREDGTELNDLYGYKIKSHRWFSFQNMGPAPSPRHGQTMTAIRDRLFVIGGDNDFAKMEDASLVYILDSTKIKYPVQAMVPTAPVEEKPPLTAPAEVQPAQSLSQEPQPYLQRQQSLQASQQPPQPIEQRQKPLQPSPVSHTPLKIIPGALNNEGQQESPTTGSPKHRNLYAESQPPVRPPRHISTVPEAALRRPRTTSSPHSAPEPIDAEIQRTQQTSAEEPNDDEREMLLREIKTRDSIISDMKKKESWWRAEVSMARKLQNREDGGFDADEALLMDVDHLPEEQVKLFEQLVTVKSELRRVRASIHQTPMSDKVHQADRMRTAALQEAAYFKSKYLAIKARRQEDLDSLEISRSDELEKRLAAALSENEAKSKQLMQLQKRSDHDQAARLATEERARESHARAEEAQQAHQRALEELQAVYSRATKAESQVRENAIKIVDLTHQLSEALTAQPAYQSQDVSEAQLKASQLEAANLKARNESAALKQRLAESMDDIDRLNTLLHEREDALNEAKMNIEDYEIQLNMLRDAVNQKSPVNGFAPTTAY